MSGALKFTEILGWGCEKFGFQDPSRFRKSTTFRCSVLGGLELRP